MEDHNIIKVRDLIAGFDENIVLSDINLDIKQKEITVILGGSGCGKSTLLKHLLGIYRAEQGTIEVLGKNIGEIDEKELSSLYLKIGVFYQNGALLNSFTVADNVALPLEQHTNLPSFLIEDIVRMKLGLVKLEGSYHHFPSELSGGMLKRAALARAIVMDPPLIFCDEPGAGLDPVSLKELDELILDLKQQLGITIILITHEISSIKRLADKIIFLANGGIAFEGTYKEAVNSSVKEVAAFFEER